MIIFRFIIEIMEYLLLLLRSLNLWVLWQFEFLVDYLNRIALDVSFWLTGMHCCDSAITLFRMRFVFSRVHG